MMKPNVSLFSVFFSLFILLSGQSFVCVRARRSESIYHAGANSVDFGKRGSAGITIDLCGNLNQMSL